LFLAIEAAGADFFVAPDPGPGGDGSQARPWSLGTALSHPPEVKPGDTIWLRGGTYVGRFTSTLSGTSDQPIVVRQYPGEWARIDGGPGPLVPTLTVAGKYTWYWGFEIFSSDTKRKSAQDGSAPTDLNRGAGVFTAQDEPHPGLKLINLVVHDASEGMSLWLAATDMEVHGNLIYNNGWDGATDRGHGHGIYMQNQTGTKIVSDNIVFNNYGSGIIAYGSDSTYLDNITLSGNTMFSNGNPSAFSWERNLLFGGGRVANGGNVWDNCTFFEAGGPTTGVYFGYEAGVSNFTIRDNVFVSVSTDATTFGGVTTNLTMTGNKFFQNTSGVSELAYPSNFYYHKTRPTGTDVHIRPNAYESGRANITIYNWSRDATVDVDVSGYLAIFSRFEVRNAQDFFAPPVVSGIFLGEPLRLPMTGLTVVQAIGATEPLFPTSPGFNVFVLLPYWLGCMFDVGDDSVAGPGTASTEALRPCRVPHASDGLSGVVRHPSRNGRVGEDLDEFR
jgi:parallel beta-helix repeat protein